MGYTAEQLIAIAEAEVGYTEKASNSQLDDKTANAGQNDFTKYARDLSNAGYYRLQGQPWCDMFTDWCFYMLCNKNKEKALAITCQTDHNGAYCPWSLQNYKKANRLYSAPLPGDQIFFDYSDTNPDADHTGIVYLVDATGVYTIEGNASWGSTRGSKKLTKKSNPGVYYSYYKLTDTRIIGYGRPLYDENSVTDVKPFEQNYEAIQSATKHNFFAIELVSVFSTEATVKINVMKNDDCKWSYTLTNLLENTDVASKANLAVSALDRVALTGLKPYTPYVLKITAKTKQLQSSQQIFFSTTQDLPNAISGLSVTFDNTALLSKKCEISFNRPKTWGADSINKNNGYRVSLVINGKIVAYSDSLVDSRASTVTKTISLLDFLKLDRNIKLVYGDTVQIGVQTWIKDSRSKIILNSIYPTCSKPFYLENTLRPVNKLHIKITNGFKRLILWFNN